MTPQRAMNSPRLWIALLVLVTFLAGSASGLLYASATRPQTHNNGPFDDYSRAFCARFKDKLLALHPEFGES